MTRQLERLTEALLTAAKRAGADAADAIAVDGVASSIDIRQGALEQAERAEGVEMGLRVLVGQRQACVSVSDISDATIAAVAERAVAMAREAPQDPWAGLADPSQLAQDRDATALQLCDSAPEVSAAALEDDARRAEAAAMAVQGITQVEASASQSRRRIHLAASNGFAGGYMRSSRSVSAVAFAGEGSGMERDWAAEGRIFATDLPGADEIGTLAAERALARLGARKPRTGTFPVLYDERISAGLIGHLLGAAAPSPAAPVGCATHWALRFCPSACR